LTSAERIVIDGVVGVVGVKYRYLFFEDF